MSAREESLLEQLLEAQQQTNALLARLVQMQEAMVQALAAEGADPDAPPVRDLAGRLIR
ncbi:hypothetical protein D9M71_476340 [compost metagenome]